MKRVLMLVHSFPPVIDIDSLLFLRYVKHLGEFGWHPYVLTARGGLKRNALDKSLLADVPEGVKIIRTPFADLTIMYRWPMRLAGFAHYDKHWYSDMPLSILRAAFDIPVCTSSRAFSKFFSRFLAVLPPDPYIGWIPFAYRAARRIISQENIHVVYTSGNPHSIHLTGYFLNRATGIPWVADLRDEWTQKPGHQPLFTWQGRFDARLEHLVLSTADRVTASTDAYRDAYSRRVDGSQRGKFVTIPNTYDEDDFADFGTKRTDPLFSISYCGSLYAMQQPGHFLAALRSLVEDGEIPLSKLKVTFAGQVEHRLQRMFQDYVLRPAIRYMGFVSHREAVWQMKKTDVLLLIVGSARGKNNIPAKTSEYIASGRPVLALVPPNGATAELIRKTRSGIVVEPENVERIKIAIMHLYTKWSEGEFKLEQNWDEIRKYEAKEVTNNLCTVLNSLVLG